MSHRHLIEDEFNGFHLSILAFGSHRKGSNNSILLMSLTDFWTVLVSLIYIRFPTKDLKMVEGSCCFLSFFLLFPFFAFVYSFSCYLIAYQVFCINSLRRRRRAFRMLIKADHVDISGFQYGSGQELSMTLYTAYRLLTYLLRAKNT